MEEYLASIRSSAFAIMDGAHAWTGGVFKALGDSDFIYDAVIHKNKHTQSVIADAKSEMLSGGTLTAIICSLILFVLLITVTIVCICFTCIASNRRKLFDSTRKLRVTVISMNDRLPIKLQILFAIVCFVLLILAIIPLVLTLAANSAMHAQMSESNSGAQYQLKSAMGHADAFLENLIPQLRRDLKPVLDETLVKTKEMKEKSQEAYQLAFQEKIGALKLLSSSDAMLYRLKLYYIAGQKISNYKVSIESAIEVLRKEFVTSSLECNPPPSDKNLCNEHKEALKTASGSVKMVADSWRDTLLNGLKSFSEILGGFKSTLSSAENTPEKLDEKKAKKMKVKDEFNKNITRVFDKELNSTEFLLNSIRTKVGELEEKIDAGRGELRNVSASLIPRFAQKSTQIDKKRFLITLILLLILLITLIYIATVSSVTLVLPKLAAKKLTFINFGILGSYCVYALLIIFNCLMFSSSTMVNNYLCRYLVGQPTSTPSIIDQSLLPGVNKVLSEMKLRAKLDVNATDQIPIKSLGSLFDGIRIGCRADQPILQALGALDFIDYNVSDSSEASMQFKIKGRNILKREMSHANLSVLYDAKLIPDSESLKKLPILDRIKTDCNFTGYRSLLKSIHKFEHIAKNELNKLLNITQRLQTTGTGPYKRLLEIEIGEIKDRFTALTEINNFSEYYLSTYDKLEASKNIGQVIDEVIAAAIQMNKYLTNQTLWTETAVKYYTEYVIQGTVEESKEISQFATRGFMSVLAKCRSIYDLYDSAVEIPCKSALYPLSIIWFCLAWCIIFAILFSLFAHLSVVCFVPVTASDAVIGKNNRGVEEIRLQASRDHKQQLTDGSTATEELLVQNPLAVKS